MKLLSYLLILLGLVLCIPLRAAEPLDPDSERFMEFRLRDGTTLNSALAIYPKGQSWLFPLGELSQGLGMSLYVSTALGKVEGTMADPSLTFFLDLQKCEVRIKENETKYPCSDVVVHEDEVYVLKSLLESWLPIQLDVNPFASEVRVTPLIKLPIQLRKERESLAAQTKGLEYEVDPGFPRYRTPYEIFEGPVLTNQLLLSPQFLGRSKQEQWQYSSQLGGEIAGLEAFGFLTGSERKPLESWRLRLERRSPNGGLLGPLNARSVQFIDVDLPALPLISPLTPGRGFLISSYPINQPTTFDTTDFQGPLLAGWEVLLYRNEILIDRAIDNGSGRYLFKNVPIFFGRNTFRFSFFGPQGERRDEYKNFNIGPELALPGEHQYRFGLISSDTAKQRATLFYNKNFLKQFMFSAGALYQSHGPRNYAMLGLSGVNDYFIFNSYCAVNTAGGKACEWGGLAGSEFFNFALKYTRLFDFQSEVFNRDSLGQLSQLNGSLNWVVPIFPPLALTWEAVRKNSVGDVSQTILRNRVALSTQSMYWRNELSYELGVQNPVSGVFDLNFFKGVGQLRWALEYTPNKIKQVRSELRLTDPFSYSFGILGNYSFENSQPSFTLSASKLSDLFSVGADFTYTNKTTYQTSLRLAFSLGRDPRDGELILNRIPMAQNGYASILVFVDQNLNGEWEPDEKGVPGVKVNVNGRELQEVTGADGKVMAYMLIPHLPVDVNISPQSLEDPSLRAEQPGVRFVPRAGKFSQIQLPLWRVGEIDGEVTHLTAGKNRPKRGVRVELWQNNQKVKESITDREGIYAFDAVPPGKYRLQLSQEQLKSSGIASKPAHLDIEIGKEGSYLGNQNFELVIP